MDSRFIESNRELAEVMRVENERAFRRAKSILDASNVIRKPRFPYISFLRQCPECRHKVESNCWLLHPLGLRMRYFKCINCDYEYADEVL